MNISDFLPDVYLDAQGVPEAIALHALRNSLRDFCEYTKAWQADATDVDLLADTQEYPLAGPSDSEFVAILTATYNDAPYDVRTLEEMDRILPTWRSDTGTGVAYLAYNKETLFVSPIPTADDSYPVIIRAAYKPTISATTCGDSLEEWREGISAGALARIKMISGKPWTDPQSAAFNGSLSEAAKRKARTRVLGGYTQRDTIIPPAKY